MEQQQQQQSAGDGAAHKRVYQACLPCRKRKVRCDLGPVDNPHDPPCVRCRRESKECFFSATRRKRKDGEDDLGDEGPDGYASYNVRRKGARTHGSFDGDSAVSPLDGPQDAGYSNVRQGVHTPQETEATRNEQVTNEEAAALFQSPIHTPGDALHLLLKASNQSEELQAQGQLVKPDTAVDMHTGESRRASKELPSAVSSNAIKPPPAPATMLDPAIMSMETVPRFSPSHEALSILSRLRFVRAGWFTAREAMAYIEYYYRYLAPLTPIFVPDLRDLGNRPDLLSEEPVLTVTLLTIASRYMKLDGPGSQTRCLMIHDRLWKYLQNMVTRMFWGQEQFGGGFCGAGARKMVGAQTDKGRLRTLGTIESLLLLSDFHPRSMHFPPNDDDEDVLAPDEEELRGMSHAEAESPGKHESTFAGWTEPAVRSDRISWSLIGFAHVLACELGIFGTYDDGGTGLNLSRPNGSSPYQKRVDRIEQLLYVYMVNACGRFGLPSLYPENRANSRIADLREGFHSSSKSVVPEEVVQQYWVEIASINKVCNSRLFPTKEITAKLIQSGEYIGRLQELLPMLDNWRSKLNMSDMPKYPKTLLSIEVHYFRLYMNGLALQAVIEQWTTKIGGGYEPTSPQSPDSTLSSSFSSIYNRNEQYIREVVDASRTILNHVVYDLLPNDYLKHAPVRAFFRIVSAAMFLLKTFALGAKRFEVDHSLHLMDRTISALRTSVVDDVHLCLRIADLLEGLTSKIRRKFIPFAPEHRTPGEGGPMFSPISPSAKQQHSNNTSPAHRFAGHTHNNMRFIRKPQDNDPDESNLLPTYLGAPNSNITVMPPPRSMYQSKSSSYPGGVKNNNNNLSRSAAFQAQPAGPGGYPFTAPDTMSSLGINPIGASNASASGGGMFGSEEDWLTLDLQPLITSSDANTPSNNHNIATNTLPTSASATGLANSEMNPVSSNGAGVPALDDTWFGNAFGPETNNNFEVLGKLVDEVWPVGLS